MNEFRPMPSETSASLKQLEQFVRLKSVLFEMEESLGLKDVSAREIRVLCAIVDLRSQRQAGEVGEAVGTDEVREHAWCRDMALPTFYRAMKGLAERKLITRTPDRGKTQRYTVSL